MLARVRFLAIPIVSFLLACAASTPPSEPAPGSAPSPAASPDPAGATSPAGAPGKTNPAGGICGGIAGFACEPGLYCSFPLDAACGAADQTGTCTRVPEMCTEEFAPVCGCNDKTYPNACYAAREGISVGRKGECAAPPADTAPAESLAEGQTCGTRGVRGECAAGLYCAYKSSCGETDSGGVCTKRPEMCTRDYRPVCGCDGKTHGNACTAASAGVAIRANGECPKGK
ncbi:MAG TPA: Kazal-type serine protease inhibitor domain-containing protein [Polyangiaceae bacterium]